MKIRILNWDTYNEKRKDVKSPSWFRMENKFAQSQSLYGVPAVERYVFFTILGLASERQAGELEFELGWFLHFHGAGAYGADEFLSALELLDGRTIEVVEWPPERVTDTLRERHADVSGTARYGRTDGRTDPTTTSAQEIEKSRAVRGPVPELADSIGAEEMLKTIEHETQHVWISTCGLELIRAQLPLAYANWKSRPDRQLKGGIGYFLVSWFQNEKKRQGELAVTEGIATRGVPEEKRAAGDSMKSGGLYVPSSEETKRANEEREKIAPADPDKVRKLIRSVTKGVPDG